MTPATVPAGMPIVYLKAGCTDPAFMGDGWYGFDEAQQIHCGPFGHAVEAAFEMGKYAAQLERQRSDNEKIISLCLRCIKVWGRNEIERVAIGEVGELLTLFGREVQNRAKHADWLDEIADVMLMAHQLACLHDHDAVMERVTEKMAKLEAKLVKAEAETQERDRKVMDKLHRPWKAK